MMSNPLEEQLQHYTRLFEQSRQSMNGLADKPHFQRQWKALKQLQEVEFPNRKNEDWKYTPALPILKLGEHLPLSRSANLPHDDGHADLTGYHVHMVNGKFSQDSLDLLAQIDGLEIARGSDYEGSAMIFDLTGQESDPLGLLHDAFSTEPIVFHIKKNAIIDKPIIIHAIQQAEKHAYVNSNYYIIAENGSEATFLELQEGGATASFINAGARIVVKENAHVHHYRLQFDQAENAYVNSTRISQSANSTFSSYIMDAGGKTVRNNLYTTLLGSNTTTNYYGAYIGTDDQHIDNQTFIDHALPHCESNELYKGILDDKATGVFNGKVMVRQDAQKTNAYQQNSSLVLNPGATMNTKPQLEIFADDVRCSHGATIGQLDESSMYYLRTRGFSKDQARKMLQFAFIDDVLEHFKNAEIRDFAHDLLTQKLG